MRPEDSILIQENLGSDIIMVFDECTDYPSPYEEAKKSMELSMRWAKRCKDAHKSKSAIFGIVQERHVQRFKRRVFKQIN